MQKLTTSPMCYHWVDYSDFNQYVELVYGKPFECEADLESPNDTSHTFHGIKKEPITHKWDIDKLEKFKATGNGSYLTRLLLWDLVNNDLAPEGDYLIRVCW